MADTPNYKNASLPVEQRVEDLLSQMTLREKIGQMTQLDARCEPEKFLRDYGVGSFLHTVIETDVPGRLQKFAAENTRLGIPLLFGIDAIHGHNYWPGTTVFPTQLALSQTWNPDLLQKVGRAVAREMSCTGQHWTFSPVLCMTRDLRWGRVAETFGEDGVLIGDLAAAMIRGYQGEDLSDPESVLACAKHYAGYGETIGGRDSSEAEHTRRKMLDKFLPPFEQAVQAGCQTFMTGYQATDGVPCTASRWLLTELLRDEWGFDGLVVTDWNNINHLIWQHFICDNFGDASRIAIWAGNDMIMATPAFLDEAPKQVEAGQIPMEWVDQAVRRILTLKFRLGLFENPGKLYPDLDRCQEIHRCDEHLQLTLEAARSSLVLLKNDENLLPLGDAVRSIALLGPNADDHVSQMGDWTYGCMHNEFGYDRHPREQVTTIRDALTPLCGERGINLTYAPGCAAFDKDDLGDDALTEAANLAQAADLAIMVVGDNMGQWGEGKDRGELNLIPRQQELLEAVHATGTPMVVVVLTGKPLTIPWVQEHAQAILLAHNPGLLGGQAVVEALSGQLNPSGKLTISWAKHIGQQPVFYDQMPAWHGSNRYVEFDAKPLWPFGFGMSYTSYRYDNIRIANDTISAGQSVQVSVDVTNTGMRDGLEIVQCYVDDKFASITQPRRRLKAYRRVEVAAGATQTVAIDLPYEALSFVNADLQRVVEPGLFEILVGPSSLEDDLLKVECTVVA